MLTLSLQVMFLLTADDDFDVQAYLLPFAIVVGVCFVVMIGLMIFKYVQDRRRDKRHRLPKSALKKIPVIKFKEGDPYETCCICLDDYTAGEKLRVFFKTFNWVFIAQFAVSIFLVSRCLDWGEKLQ